MSARVYVGRIPYRATERDIKKFFKGYGKIAEIIMKNGFAFVDFEDNRDAEEAVRELNGKDLLGVCLTIDIARGTPHGRDRYNYVPPPRVRSASPRRPKRYRIIVENLSSRVTSKDLKELFRKAGDVVRASANEKHKNEGFVEFESSREVDRAFDKLDGIELEGRKIRLVEEKRKKRSRSRSKSRTPVRKERRSRSGENGGEKEAETVNGGEAQVERSRSRSHSQVDEQEQSDDEKGD